MPCGAIKGFKSLLWTVANPDNAPQGVFSPHILPYHQGKEIFSQSRSGERVKIPLHPCQQIVYLNKLETEKPFGGVRKEASFYVPKVFSGDDSYCYVC